LLGGSKFSIDTGHHKIFNTHIFGGPNIISSPIKLRTGARQRRIYNFFIHTSGMQESLLYDLWKFVGPVFFLSIVFIGLVIFWWVPLDRYNVYVSVFAHVSEVVVCTICLLFTFGFPCWNNDEFLYGNHPPYILWHNIQCKKRTSPHTIL
jgi:hypothetical protein